MPQQSESARNSSVPNLRLVKKIAYLMDEQFRFPGTNFRFGLDPLINLFPFVGDLAGFFISSALLLMMAKKGAGNKLVVLMSINVFLDATLGAIPFVGQIFDFYFKANSRNIRLMREHFLEGKHKGSGRNTLIFAIIILIIMAIGIVFLTFKFLEWLAEFF